MKLHFKITSDLLEQIHRDLARPHPFAFERVGFIVARCTRSTAGVLIFAVRYVPVADDGYEEDASVGAMMNQGTIFNAMQIAYNEKTSIFHVHEHPGFGTPKFSRTDRRENAKFVPSFINVRPEYPHGALVLSGDRIAGICWLPGSDIPSPIDAFTVVGSHLRKIV